MAITANLTNSSTITCLFTYHPYWLEYRSLRNPKFDDISLAILDFKKGNINAINKFHRILSSKLLRNNFVICIAPSHETKNSNANTPLSILAKKLIKSNNLIDGTECLIRTNTIEKLATGGCRNINIHLDSIEIKHPEIIQNKEVVVLDDIKTTGNTLKACQKLLLEAGAETVWLCALAETAQDKQAYEAQRFISVFNK